MSELDPKHVPPRLVAAQRVIAEWAVAAAEKRIETPMMVEGESPTRRRSRSSVGASGSKSMRGAMNSSPTSGADDAAGQRSRPITARTSTTASHTARWVGFGVTCSPEQVGCPPAPATWWQYFLQQSSSRGWCPVDWPSTHAALACRLPKGSTQVQCPSNADRACRCTARRRAGRTGRRGRRRGRGRGQDPQARSLTRWARARGTTGFGKLRSLGRRESDDHAGTAGTCYEGQ